MPTSDLSTLIDILGKEFIINFIIEQSKCDRQDVEQILGMNISIVDAIIKLTNNKIIDDNLTSEEIKNMKTFPRTTFHNFAHPNDDLDRSCYRRYIDRLLASKLDSVIIDAPFKFWIGSENNSKSFDIPTNIHSSQYPLHRAVQSIRGLYTVWNEVEQLLKGGIDPYLLDDDGMMAKHHLIYYASRFNIVSASEHWLEHYDNLVNRYTNNRKYKASESDKQRMIKKINDLNNEIKMIVVPPMPSNRLSKDDWWYEYERNGDVIKLHTAKKDIMRDLYLLCKM